MLPEPWLRGIQPDIHPVIGHLLRASEHIREDVRNAAVRLTREQLWVRPETMNPVGFHLKHLAGSTERLLTYLKGSCLSSQQLAAIAAEGIGDEDAGELLTRIDGIFALYDDFVRSLSPSEFASVRKVGRAQLPVTAIGLAIHITEHGHRHAGQIVSAAALARLTIL